MIGSFYTGTSAPNVNVPASLTGSTGQTWIVDPWWATWGNYEPRTPILKRATHFGLTEGARVAAPASPPRPRRQTVPRARFIAGAQSFRRWA